MSYYLKNLDILSKRFPYLYLLMLSNKKVINKKRIIRKNKNFKNFDNLDVIFIYKYHVSENYVELLNWLKKKNKKIHFLENNLDDLSSFFNTKIAYGFLKNKKVHFHFFTKTKKIIDEITSFAKSTKVEMITYLNENKKFLDLREKVLEKNLISFFLNHDRINSHRLFKNFYSNLDHLKNSFLINACKNKFKNIPAIVVGAGPSLKYSFEKIKQMDSKALIIAAGSAITCLSQQNILPHLGVIIDPNFEEYKRMKESLSFQIPIIYSTRVNKGVFYTFNGSLGYIKAMICGFFEAWLDKEMKTPGKYVLGERENKALSVTTICLIIAKMLGCNPIILDGVDLAYTENQLYAFDIIDNNQSIFIEDELIYTKNKNNKDVCSNLKWEIERKWISEFASDNKNYKFLNATKSGLKINNVQELSLDEIEKIYLKKADQFDLKSYLHALIQESMISKSNIKKIKIKLKKSFINTIELLDDIIKNEPDYLAILAKEKLSKEIAYIYFLFEIDYMLNKFSNKKNNSNYIKLKEAAEIFLNEIKKVC